MSKQWNMQFAHLMDTPALYTMLSQATAAAPLPERDQGGISTPKQPGRHREGPTPKHRGVKYSV